MATRGDTGPDPPEQPSERLVLRPPPTLNSPESSGGALSFAIPMVGSLGSVLLVLALGTSDHHRSYLAAAVFAISGVGLVVVQLDRQRTQRIGRVSLARRQYLRYLGDVRQTARRAADEQRRALAWRHPAPAALPAVAQERSRIWERTGPSDGFLRVRYGVGRQRSSLELVPPEVDPFDRVDPVAASELHRLLDVHRSLDALPTDVDLRATRQIELRGSPDRARALARSVICSATAFHDPGRLVVAVLSAPRHLADWDWVKWLPHTASTEGADAVGPRRLVATSAAALAALLPGGLPDRPRVGLGEPRPTQHLLLVVDGVDLPRGDLIAPPSGRLGATQLFLAQRPGLSGASRGGDLEDAGALRLLLEDLPPEDGRIPVTAMHPAEEPRRSLADQCDLATAEAFARRVAPLATSSAAERGARETTSPRNAPGVLGLGDVHGFDPSAAWRPGPAGDRLRVPVGVADDGAVVHLDLKESAEGGMGPHGLVVGATGSGKSELLRTLVLGLGARHSPAQLTMVLVDFKGGATFAGLSQMPHVSALITNLAQDLTLVDRMQDALSGELVRRQELLRAAGNYASARDYDRARAARRELPPLSSLLIVVDEFSELLSAEPEFIDLFVTIGRLGRSLGLHLLLASQRLEEGRLRGLEAHLSYRIGLRTFSAAESRAVLGSSDAHDLPPVPGLAYLRPDPSTLVRFRTSFVSGPPPSHPRLRPGRTEQLRGILPFTVAEVRPLGPPPPSADPPTPAADSLGSVLEIVVARMKGHGPPAHQVWLPPLDASDPLDRLFGDLAEDPTRGLGSPSWRRSGGLRIPLGTVDRPREQRRDTLEVDLRGGAGHVAVVGGPRSGKSTLLRTIVASLSLATTPLEAHFFVLDFGGGAFESLRSLPHVAGLATRSERDVVRRMVAEVAGILSQREAYFRARGIESIDTYRTRRSSGLADDGYGEVFLLVDGWATLRADFEDLEPDLQLLADRGLAFGLHLVAGASRWADFRSTMRDQFGTRLELRLGDPTDSEIDRRAAALVPPGRPGRGLVHGGRHCLAALPRIDGSGNPADLASGVDDLVARVRTAWRGPSGPRLRLLPDRIGLDAVRVQSQALATPASILLLGIDERQLTPVGLDPGLEPHVVAFGDGRSGKTALLRTYLHEIMRIRSPEQAQLVVVDYRRSLLDEVPEEYLLHYLTSPPHAQPALDELAAYLNHRMPGPEVTVDQLRGRTWWTGAEVFVVVDDYDLVATQQGSAVQALEHLLPHARDIGLHLAIARRSGGASRALYEPVLQTMRDLATPALLLSGSPDEGPLVGALKPVPAPPGRARLVTRDRGIEVVQVAWTDAST